MKSERVFRISVDTPMRGPPNLHIDSPRGPLDFPPRPGRAVFVELERRIFWKDKQALIKLFSHARRGTETGNIPLVLRFLFKSTQLFSLVRGFDRTPQSFRCSPSVPMPRGRRPKGYHRWFSSGPGRHGDRRTTKRAVGQRFWGEGLGRYLI